MAEQPHNLGYLRKSVEDALVAHLANAVSPATVRPAYTTTAMENPVVVVHATGTRERNEESYTLARHVDVEVSAITYAEDVRDHTETILNDARTAHYDLVAQIYHALAQSDIVATLNSLGVPRVAFWLCYAKTDAGDITDGAFRTRIQVEVGASPVGD